MSTKFIFDVDGVLCDRGQKINDRFRGWVEDFLKDKEYYLLTGSPREKTKNQIGMVLTFGPKIGYYCLGNSIWTQNGFEVVLNRLSFSEDELKHLKSFYDHSLYRFKQPWDDVLQYRSGSCNFSLVKRGSTIDERQYYINYATQCNEREDFIMKMNDRFPRFECYIGGDTSIDIVLRGANKAQIFNSNFHPNDTIYFFGDKCDEYGIDKPVYDYIKLIGQTAFNISGGYKETWEILKTL
jgi:hydroxymethylpyrimidine pyrophosphatase-like HAD family hydrolase|tara:strand:+ start:64 stop:780 length:717 start_codon:yes stop_codon:yes gene_type:complete